MATGKARPGKERAYLAAAREHAEALREQPGCVAAYVLRERGTGDQVALSIFTSEEAFNRGMEATRPVIAKHHLEDLTAGDSTFRLFDVT